MQRREFLTASIASMGWIRARAAEPNNDPQVELRQVLERACTFLWQQQSEDGGWHSRTYAVLRSGQALTPYCLEALLRVPETVVRRSADRVAAGLAFIRRHAEPLGVMGWDDPEVPEYPNHSTAAAIGSLTAGGQVDDQGLIERLAQSLITAQYAEPHGFTDRQLAYGAWGFATPRVPGRVEHLDISHTRHCLQALRSAEAYLPEFHVPAGTYARSLRFLRLLQRHPDEDRSHPQPLDWPEDAPPWNGQAESFDGGFYFSPTALAANKGGWQRDPSHWKSYSTATCDGCLALLSAGVPERDPRVQAAADWLRRYAEASYPAGVPKEGPESWGAAIRFYHFAARSECSAAISLTGPWRSDMLAALAVLQNPDGSFVNRESHLMKEDDPLLATSLAIRGLNHARV